MAGSNWLSQLDAKYKQGFDAGKEVWEQYNLDTAIVTLHRLGWGYKRIIRFCDLWSKVYDEYFWALDRNKVDSDILREHLDREIKDIVKDNQEFHPFEKRFPKLRSILYSKKRKGWT